MKIKSVQNQVFIILLVFVISRLITWLLGLNMNFWALSAYWQYLDLETLRHHLLRGLWYDHAQPPVFNLFLGLIIKIGDGSSLWIYAVILKLISLTNALLLFSIVRKIVSVRFIPLAVALAYLLSPATLIFECELFYTTTVSLLLLLSVYFLLQLSVRFRWSSCIGFISPLVLLCLSRSVYHLFWLVLIAVVFVIYFRRRIDLKKLVITALAGILLTGSWYVKNKIIFGKFTASTWLGMNMARNVFHDNEIKDSGRIEAYEPFSRISVYRKFLDPDFENRFRGLNDRDLLMEMKNDSFINENQVSYIRVSELYQKASMEYVKAHPGAYAKNIIQSFILYFSPATIYSLAVEQSAKIKYYDLVYSFNLTHFAEGKQTRRILLTISALPKLILYLIVFWGIFRIFTRQKTVSSWNLFILCTILFVFGISSLFEHYENMRFRFETEPLFLILAAQVFNYFYSRWRVSRTDDMPAID